jgi:anti-sigma regulatory factor (Ser/Thr protein kinase)
LRASASSLCLCPVLPAMSHGYDLSIEARLDNLEDIRHFIDQAGKGLGVSKQALGDLCLVVDEAVTNVVLHGYNGLGGMVDIRVEQENDAVVIHIRDQGKAFDASDSREPQLHTALSERPFGGMGLYLIRKLTDEAEFRTLPGRGNELRLVKRQAIAV